MRSPCDAGLVPTTPLFALHRPIHSSSGGIGKHTNFNESKKLQLTLSLSLGPKKKIASGKGRRRKRRVQGKQEATTHAELILAFPTPK
jgi:hypothetical protein